MVPSLLSPALGAAPSPSPTASPATSPLAGAAGQQTPQPETPDGVRFDLSDAALRQIAAAAALRGESLASSTPEPPAGLVDRSGDAAGPTDQGRARAWAIRGMDRDKLLALVSTLNATPGADPAEKEVARHTAAQPHIQIAPSSDRLAA